MRWPGGQLWGHPWRQTISMGLLVGIFFGVLYLDKTTATSKSQHDLKAIAIRLEALTQDNHARGIQNAKVLAILQADDAIIRDATTPGGVINSRGNEATTAAVTQLIVCINNHIDVVLLHKPALANCPGP